MFKIIENKSLVDVAVSQLLDSLVDVEQTDNIALDELNKKNDILNKTNMKLLNEIKEKDSIITNDKRTILEYKEQINSINEVKEEENKFGMLKAKDKEISNLNKELMSLRKELEQCNSKLELMTDTNNVGCEVHDVEEDVEEDLVKPTKDTENKPLEETVADESSVKDSEESDDEPEYISVKYKKQKYYVEKNNPNSKMYKILDNLDVGEEVGQMTNGKKKLHK